MKTLATFELQDDDSMRECEGRVYKVANDDVWIDTSPFRGRDQGPTVIVGLRNGVFAVRVYGGGFEEPLVVLNFGPSNEVVGAQHTPHVAWEPL